MTTQVHMLWVNGSLSPFEQLSAKSFLKNNYQVNLWSYEPIKNVPAGVNCCDANLIVPKEKLFLTLNSYANFSDLFRYAVLQSQGGMWSDIDVVALKPESELPSGRFFVVEDKWEGSFRQDKPFMLNGNIINYPDPEEGSLIDMALTYADKFPKHKMKWAEIGPDLLHQLVEIYPNHGFTIQDVRFANSIPAGEITDTVLKPGTINPHAHFLHLYNDMWKRINYDKNTPPPKGSILDNLMELYA